MNTTTTTAARAMTAAQAAARMLPATSPLEAIATPEGSGPSPTDTAVTAALIGSPSADLVLVVSDVVSDALAAGGSAGAPLELADALRPALEAAAAALGSGVLDAARTVPASQAFEPDTEVVALAADGEVLGWFGLRMRSLPSVAATVPGVPTQRASMDMLYDVEMTLTAELGRTRLPVRQVLEMVPGTILELDKAAGSPADVLVNGRLVARGEVVVVDEDYGIRITEIITTEGGH